MKVWLHVQTMQREGNVGVDLGGEELVTKPLQVNAEHLNTTWILHDLFACADARDWHRVKALTPTNSVRFLQSQSLCTLLYSLSFRWRWTRSTSTQHTCILCDLFACADTAKSLKPSTRSLQSKSVQTTLFRSLQMRPQNQGPPCVYAYKRSHTTCTLKIL